MVYRYDLFLQQIKPEDNGKFFMVNKPIAIQLSLCLF